MLDLRGAPGDEQHGDDVEADLDPPGPRLREPLVGEPPDPGRLRPRDRLHGQAVADPGAGLDLADHEAVPVGRDDVELAVAPAPVPGQDDQAAARRGARPRAVRPPARARPSPARPRTCRRRSLPARSAPLPATAPPPVAPGGGTARRSPWRRRARDPGGSARGLGTTRGRRRGWGRSAAPLAAASAAGGRGSAAERTVLEAQVRLVELLDVDVLERHDAHVLDEPRRAGTCPTPRRRTSVTSKYTSPSALRTCDVDRVRQVEPALGLDDVGELADDVAVLAVELTAPCRSRTSRDPPRSWSLSPLRLGVGHALGSRPGRRPRRTHARRGRRRPSSLWPTDPSEESAARPAARRAAPATFTKL